MMHSRRKITATRVAIALLIVAVLGNGTCSIGGPPSDEPERKNAAAEVIPLEDCKAIHLFLHGAAWIVKFLPDGSGSIQYGSSFGDGGSFPPGTADFEALYEATKKSVYTTDSTPHRFTLNGVGKEPTYGVMFEPTEDRNALYSTNRKPLEKAFLAGFNATGYVKNQLDYLYLVLPPFDRERINFGEKGPSIDGAKSIGLFTRSGWQLHIHSNGSGYLSSRNDAAMKASFPAKTFKMMEVFERIQAKPRKDQDDRFQKQHVIFAVKRRKSEYRMVAYAANLDVANTLFLEAWKKAIKPSAEFPGQTLDVMFTNYPPIRPAAKTKQ
ncbi:MAG: hypothetical protein ACI9G1_000212 [Pirellulaceae bacterium]|jgi:hypothetical protein